MRNASEMVLKAFLSRCPPAKADALIRFLPEADASRLEKLPSFSEDVRPEEFSNGNILEHVHWSWLLPTLKTYSAKEQKLFLSALAPPVALNLRETLKIASSAEEISAIGRSFLRQTLQDSLTGPENRLLPIDYLPASPLNTLLSLSKKELIQLIDFLSLYDLAAEIRQIVETKILKKIYSFLSEAEKKALKQVMSHQKEPFLFSRMALEKWDGTKEALRLSLHRKGLARFGVALSGQDPDFIWYICHQLDIGRGNSLFKLCAKEALPHLTDAVIRQIEDWVQKSV